MSYHNVRDNKGRFTKAGQVATPVATTTTPRRKYAKVRATNNKPVEGNTIVLNAFILDDSGSMAFKRDAVIEGFNGVLAAANQAVMDTKIPSMEFLATFGSPGRFKWQPGAQPLTPATYTPNQASTALYEAIQLGIEGMERAIAKYPTKIVKPVFTVFTDGEENVFNVSVNKVKQLVQEKISQGWVIAYVGAGAEDRIRMHSEAIGVHHTNTLAYNNTVEGTRGAMKMSAFANTSYSNKVAAGTDSAIGFFSDK